MTWLIIVLGCIALAVVGILAIAMRAYLKSIMSEREMQMKRWYPWLRSSEEE